MENYEEATHPSKAGTTHIHGHLNGVPLKTSRTFHQVGFIGRASGVMPAQHNSDRTFVVRRADGNHEIYAR